MKRKIVASWVCAILVASAVVIASDAGDVAGDAANPGNGATYAPRAPIRINSDADFTAANGVSGGNGSQENPWLIGGWDIDGTGYGHCIFVGNTTEHFTIGGCTLHDATNGEGWPWSDNQGVALVNVTNGSIVGNELARNQKGIHAYNSYDILAADNSFATHNGVSFELYDSERVSLHNNTMADDGIWITGSRKAAFDTHTIPQSNTVGGRPVVYWIGAANTTIPGGAGQVILAGCYGITVENQGIHDVVCAVMAAYSPHSSIHGMNVSGNTIGIYLRYSNGTSVLDNEASNSGDGIWVFRSSDVFIGGNMAYGNEWDGIFMYRVTNSTVTSNNLSNNFWGVELYDCGYNNVTSNELFNNQYSVTLQGSSNNRIYHNNIAGFLYPSYDDGTNLWDSGYPSGGNYWSDYAGVDLYSGEFQDVPGADGIGDAPYTNLDGGMGAQDNYPLMAPWTYDPFVPGVPIRIDSNADFDAAHGVSGGDGSASNPWIIENWNIDGTGYGYCLYIGNTTDYFVVRQCSLHDASGMGVWPFYNNQGLMLFNVQNGRIMNNNASSNDYDGICLYNSSGIEISANLVKNNHWGIYLHYSDDNIILNNTAIDNIGSGDATGIYLLYSNRNGVMHNNASQNDAFGMSVEWSNNNTISNNTASMNVGCGVGLGSSSTNTITNNCAANNGGGFYISLSNNNTIANNCMSYNVYYGIDFWTSNDNRIYHNNFVNNTNQAYESSGANQWDDGYPSGGNYWSNYFGADIYSGPGQDEPGPDGIGDVSYVNFQGGSDAVDHYPLMTPWGETNATIGPVHNVNRDLYYPTIQQAVDDADPYDLIVASPGTYYEHVTISTPLTLRGTEYQTYIDAGGVASCVYVRSDGVVIDGFNLSNTGTEENPGIGYEYDSGVEICGVDNVTIGNCTFWNIYYVGVLLFTEAHGCTVSDCFFQNVGMNSIRLESAGILGEFYGNTFARNTFYEVIYGIVAYAVELRDTTIESNWFFYCTMGGISCSQVGYNVWPGTCTYNTIRGNFFLCPGVNAILVSSSYDMRSMMTISENNITGNINIITTTDLEVFHNNIFSAAPAYNSPADIWDDGYPSGGNFWADYGGVDMFSGPSQDIPGSDGIGDTPYTNIAGGAGAHDNYPLMYPWTPAVPDTSPPAHSDETPVGESVNLTPVISVRVTDISGVDASSIRLYVDGFPVFMELAPVPDGYVVSYWHDMGFDPSTNHTCRIVAADLFGNVLDFTWYFTTPPPYFVPVVLGWNLMSIPLDLFDASLPGAFLDTDTTWDRVMTYDPSNPADPWKQYNALWSPAFNDLHSLDCSMGFWIHVTAVGDGNLTVCGADPGTTTIQLRAGWNLVGYPTQTPREVALAFWSTGVDIVEAFDPAEPYLTKPVSGSYLMTPNRGYWVHALQDTVWNVDW